MIGTVANVGFKYLFQTLSTCPQGYSCDLRKTSENISITPYLYLITSHMIVIRKLA